VHAVVDRTVAENAERTVMVVCHGGVIDAALRHLLHLAPMGQVVLSTLNTSITELRTYGDGWQLGRYNDAAHLEGLPAETMPDVPNP
jgi:probable phosphoglycerate mutase